jgi:ATP-dependent protease HslVU (ClpYQ) ATPase subunit
MCRGRVPINAACVKERLAELTKDEDLSKFIL